MITFWLATVIGVLSESKFGAAVGVSAYSFLSVRWRVSGCRRELVNCLLWRNDSVRRGPFFRLGLHRIGHDEALRMGVDSVRHAFAVMTWRSLVGLSSRISQGRVNEESHLLDLSCASLEDCIGSPPSSPSPPLSPANERGSESTGDDTPIARRPFLRRDEGTFLRRNIVDLEDDREDMANAPAEDVPPAGLPSVLTRAMLNGIARTCRFPRQLQMRALTVDERPWTPPFGWMCLYEAFFTHSRLWFPLPRLLTPYAAARDIALTQFTLAAMRNVVAALSRHGILRGKVSKAHEWSQRYFFVRVYSASVANLNAVLRGTWNPSPSESLVLSLSSSWFVCDFIFALFGIFLDRHPISLPPPTGFSCGVERIHELGVQQWSDFDRDRIFRSVPRISAAAWGASSAGESGRRGRSSSCPASPILSCRAARSPSVRTGGVHREIPPYSSVMNDEPERAFGESGEVTPAAPGGGGPVAVERGASDAAPTGDFMADAIRSFVREGEESRSLKRLSEDVPTGDAPEEKRSRRNPYARVFRYNKDTPFVNDERACAEYFCLPRNAFKELPSVDDLAHAQEFKDMARSTAQFFPLLFLFLFLDLARVRAKLEDVFAEKELRYARFKELEVIVDGLTSAAEVLQDELAVSSSRAAILRAQIREKQNSLGARINYLERSHEDYAAKEVVRAVREAIAKYRGRLERVKAYLDDQERVKDLVFKENQMTGIVSCLEVCIEEGIPIPSEKLKEYIDLLDNTEVVALEDDNLVLSPLPSSS
ncbi:hypothetical protein Bca4012_057874 [Brassica carinata]